LYRICRTATAHESCDCWDLEFYLQITFNNFWLVIIESFFNCVVLINFSYRFVFFVESLKRLCHFEALLWNFFLNYLAHIMDFNSHPFKVKFLKICIFHKHFVNNPKESFCLDLPKEVIWSSVSSHLRTFQKIKPWFHTMNLRPWVWFFFHHSFYWLHNMFWLGLLKLYSKGESCPNETNWLL